MTVLKKPHSQCQYSEHILRSEGVEKFFEIALRFGSLTTYLILLSWHTHFGTNCRLC